MHLRQAALPATLCAALSLAAPHLRAAALTVSNCADAGAGSLRAAVTGATSGDVVNFDLATMQCSLITLSTGMIATNADDLTIAGPGSALLEVHGHAFLHTGNGTLTVSGLKMSSGFMYAPGSCVVGHNVTLQDDTFDHCSEYSDFHTAGAVSASGDLRASRTTFSSNYIFFSSAPSGSVAYVAGNAYIDDSIFANNMNGNGALVVGGNVAISRSTFSGNFSFQGALVAEGMPQSGSGVKIMSSTFSTNFGGGAFRARNASVTTAIYNSTLSGNSGTVCAGVYAAGPLLISNSTVVLNRASSASYNGQNGLAGGVCGKAVLLFSSIVADNNVYGPPLTLSDLSASSVIGATNLVRAPSAGTTLPVDTITDDPLLDPLSDNGGPTATHTLKAGSPALGTGSNGWRFASDQRGPGFARMTGEHTDIGAVQSGDGVFASGFE
jgi:hypothetical protein